MGPLGYSTRSFPELIALEPDAACAAVTSLLTEDGAVVFGLLCRDSCEHGFHWNRQFDDFCLSSRAGYPPLEAGSRLAFFAQPLGAQSL
jgi:hypothetical protein